MDYIHDPLRAPVKNQNVHSQRDPAIGVRQRRQAALQVLRKWLHPLLQSRRQVAVAFGQSWRQARIAVLVVAANRFTIAYAEYDANPAFVATITVAVPIVVIPVSLLVVALAFSVALSQACLWQRHRQNQPADRRRI